MKPIAAIILMALALTGCATAAAEPAPQPVAAEPKHGTVVTLPSPWTEFATNGWEPRLDVMSPFYDRIRVDLSTAEIDDTGLALYRSLATGEIVDHPIVNAQYAESALLEWEHTGDQTWLDRAVRNATELVNLHVERDGAWWFQYNWDWTYFDRTLTAPWWSGMAQGEALTVFSRLAKIQPENPVWRQAADATFASFLQRPAGDGTPWATHIDTGHLWFEEYAGNQPPLNVLNGHVFAIFGLYEYYALTGDGTAAAYIDGGATTILDNMPLFRAEGGISYYCAQLNYCHSSNWQNGDYHPIHISQLRALARITGDSRFADWAALLEQDWQPGQ